MVTYLPLKQRILSLLHIIIFLSDRDLSMTYFLYVRGNNDALAAHERVANIITSVTNTYHTFEADMVDFLS